MNHHSKFVLLLFSSFSILPHTAYQINDSAAQQPRYLLLLLFFSSFSIPPHSTDQLNDFATTSTPFLSPAVRPSTFCHTTPSLLCHRASPSSRWRYPTSSFLSSLRTPTRRLFPPTPPSHPSLPLLPPTPQELSDNSPTTMPTYLTYPFRRISNKKAKPRLPGH